MIPNTRQPMDTTNMELRKEASTGAMQDSLRFDRCMACYPTLGSHSIEKHISGSLNGSMGH